MCTINTIHKAIFYTQMLLHISFCVLDINNKCASNDSFVCVISQFYNNNYLIVP